MRLSLTPATDMQSRIRTGLLSRGMAPHIADAFIMNFKDESGLNPGINEIAPTVPGSRGGFGLYQLTGPRRVAYEQFAKERGANPADVDAQLDFMMMELQGPESRAAKSIFAAPDTGSAAAAIVTNFLRPAEQHRNSRVAKYQGGGQQSQPQGLMETFSTRSSPQTEAPMQPEKATGLLGSLFPNMTADRQDRLAMGLSGLSMFPNQGVMQGAQQRMGERREDRKEAKGQASAQQQANRTLQWLQTQAQNNPNAAQALQMLSQGVIDAKGAVQMAMQQPEARYQQVTGQTAAAMGLDPSKVYNLGPDGKVSGIGAGDTNVSVSSGSEVGTIPPGYELITDPQTGGRRLAPIPGGPVDVEQRQAAAAEEQAGQVQDEKAATQGNVVLNQVSAIRKMLDQGGMFDMPETGIVGSGLAKLGLNQEAVDMRNRLTTLQGMVSFDQLAKMRAASPTGGALGGIAIRELELLQSQLGSLDQSSSPEIIRETLDLLESVMRKAEAYPNAAEYGFGGSQLSGPSSGSGPNGTLSDEELLKKYGYTD
jgi:hypothetical protein